MKVHYMKDEWYPVYSLSEEQEHIFSEGTIQISKKQYQKFEKVEKEFCEMQGQIAKIIELTKEPI